VTCQPCSLAKASSRAKIRCVIARSSRNGRLAAWRGLFSLVGLVRLITSLILSLTRAEDGVQQLGRCDSIGPALSCDR
jgi:hypothetical protein